MHKAIWVLFALFPLAAPAQSVITIDTRQCVWRAGDDPTWGAPTLDESAWRPYSQWKSNPEQRHLWVRCHVDLTSLHGLEQPAIQVTLFSAYQLYIDGTLIGTVGNLGNGNFSLNAVRSFALTQPQSQFRPATLALRITDRSSFSLSRVSVTTLTLPLRIRTGDALLLKGLRDSESIARGNVYYVTALCYGALGVASLILLVFYLYDRSRHELLLLGLTCIALALFRWSAFAGAALVDLSFATYLWIIYGLGQLASGLIQAPFFYVVARKRIPVAIWIIVAMLFLAQIPNLLDALLAAKQPEWLDPLRVTVGNPLNIISRIAASLAPFFAFLPFGQLPRRIRPLAIPCMLWGVADFIYFAFYFAFQVPSTAIFGGPNLYQLWGSTLLTARAFTTAGVLIALVFLLLREQREVTVERAQLAGELHAASEIQRMLAPANLDLAPGMQIDVAFHPMREVGGDFYLCHVLSDGTQRIVLGDVSGKGSAAAMTATLLIGAAAARDTDPPAVLLVNLNRVLLQSRVGGFATCLCADCSPDGHVTLANAGHLAPYHRGSEISVSSSLPLGLTQQQDTYKEINFSLPPGDTLTFLSDGVVEARNASGELFGFERAAKLSTQPAEKVAQVAQAFGQEDDITVLTLCYAGVPAPA